MPYSTVLRAWIKAAVKTVLPTGFHRKLSAQQRRLTRWASRDWVRFGSLRRITPISRNWGEDRGLPIDRYYIEQFLRSHAADIRGRVLEIRDDAYTREFGSERVTKSDVLHAVAGNPRATIVADLTCADHIPPETFDCVILTQTLQYIYDTPAAVRTLHRILKPSGVLLATLPGISQRDGREERWADHWRFTTSSSRRLLGECFTPEQITVEAHGNVLVAIAFLHGLAAQELHPNELDHVDPDYEVLITVRAVKSSGPR
jgi:SAM-dependent methyltransferase